MLYILFQDKSNKETNVFKTPRAKHSNEIESKVVIKSTTVTQPPNFVTLPHSTNIDKIHPLKWLNDETDLNGLKNCMFPRNGGFTRYLKKIIYFYAELNG